jgi:hypothetical protein
MQEKDNACGIQVGAALISFRNIVDTKTRIAVAREGTAFPPNFNRPVDGRVARNM